MKTLKAICKEITAELNMPACDGRVPTTGFAALDELIVPHRWHRMGVVCLAARPGMGRRTLALDIAMNVALSSDSEVLVFSPQRSVKEIAASYIKKINGTNVSALAPYPKTDEIAIQKLYSAIMLLKEFKIMIDDSPLSMENIERALSYIRRPALVIIDTAEDLAGDKRKTAERLKSLSLKHKAPFLITTMLPCDYGERPTLALVEPLYREGADVVMALHREPYWVSDSDLCDSQLPAAELSILKNTHGDLGTVPLRFDGHLGSFVD